MESRAMDHDQKSFGFRGGATMIDKSALLACAGGMLLGATAWPGQDAAAAPTETAAAPASLRHQDAECAHLVATA
jgi:hypothetical protein